MSELTLAEQQLTTMALLGTFAQDRRRGEQLVEAATAKYDALVRRLKHTELLGLTRAVIAEHERRGGQDYAESMWDHVLGEVGRDRLATPSEGQ